MGNREMNSAGASAGLAARARAFNLMQLPGQPMMMHMGTSYLVNDLASEIIRLTQINAELTAANAALVVRVEDARLLMDRGLWLTDDARAWLASPLGYEALLGFVEEVRDCRPDVISGRATDPQDDVEDTITAEVLWNFQADAEALIGKKGAAT